MRFGPDPDFREPEPEWVIPPIERKPREPFFTIVNPRGAKMGHGDSLPEQSTTKLERAQWDYDRAVLLHTEAQHAVSAKGQAVAAAREKLEQAKREAAAAIPVDRSKRETIGGMDPDAAGHRELKPNGQQRDYVILSEAERSKGFVRPVRDAYRHLKCGKITTMSRALAETYARDPGFYSGTFCTTCGGHFPVGEDGEFTWYEMDGSEGPKVGT